VYLSADGGYQCLDCSTAGTFSAADVAFFVDGDYLPQAGYKRLIATNQPAPSTPNNWSMAVTLPLSAGPHTIGVVAGGLGGGEDGRIAGSPGNVLQAQLTVLVLKR